MAGAGDNPKDTTGSPATTLITHLTHPLRSLSSTNSELFLSSFEAKFLFGRGILLVARTGAGSGATSGNRRRDLEEAAEHLQAAAEAGDVTTAWNWLPLALLETVPLLPPEDDMQVGEVLGKAVEALGMALEEDPGNEEAKKMLMAIEADEMEDEEGDAEK
ncbi:hypothetical protein M427DRAFT_32294 [Gonapodya prolifera JEL478]|uniref:Uncharacterized protein n=1 Tax=Gonapodya prolifera (strain JEL478) TaxID=1344416 RepID=A0A139AGS4_GONPJ|nr:hypothetical protein M427DRAFT_32294 [Gonapodya prolifera JEL478]|eukprot:KXS15613.1 hypothetical protein M427DRAFT_32294 [Gonapodya prolifera JEL478]